MKTFEEKWGQIKESSSSEMNTDIILRAINKYKGKTLSKKEVEKIVYSAIKDVDEAEEQLVDLIDYPEKYGIKIK